MGLLDQPIRFAQLGEVANKREIEGTAQMKENIRFLLRAASDASFGYQVSGISYAYPSNYVYSSYYYVTYPTSVSWAGLDHFAPFKDNYFFRNFAFAAGSVNTSGTYATGFEPASGSSYWQFTNTPQFEFPTYNYVALSNQAPIPAILSSNTTQWVGFFDGDEGSGILAFGGYNSGGSLAMSNYDNLYGLPYTSLDVVIGNGFATVSPGHNISGYNFGLAAGSFYAGTAQPQLQTIGYYFGQPGAGDWGGGDPLPGYEDGSFAVTNTTPLIIGSVGTPMLIAGYAKQAVLNGYNNVFAYLGQYFTNAFVMSNGVVTTNSAGILSEYGEFFPIVPGQVALLTKPDPDQTNIQGTCVVDVIRLSLDVKTSGL
jgi:hypothetical protein